MQLSALKRIRVGISLFFLVTTSLLFLDIGVRSVPGLAETVLYPQFVPSLVDYLQGFGLAASGWGVVLLLTLGAGRVYCSSICPLGATQDVARFISRKGRRRPYRHRPPHGEVRYAVLALTISAMLAGSNLVLNLLDPFSSFGRIVVNIVRPVLLAVRNGGALVLEQFGVYALAREHWAAMAPLSTAIAFVALLVVTVLAVTTGRHYCNTICPVGTLLGLVARFSALRLRVDHDSCTQCRHCVTVCKAGCIDLDARTVDMSRCVACCNCLSVCRFNSIRLERRWQEGRRPPGPDIDCTRREFLFRSGIYLLAINGVTEPAGVSDAVRKIIQSKPTTIPVVMTSPVSPPGSVSVDHFTISCTACHLCVSACPPQILLPSLMDYGASGLMQPRMNFQTGHCRYECTICADVCPSGAILPLTVGRKKLTQTGVAKFIKENCVVYTDNTACGACSEHCPTKAVNIVPYENKLNRPLGIPEVNADFCIGCGGCEHACPTKPYKAIFVDGNRVHKLARPPVVKEVDQRVDYQEDFPF